MQVPERKTYFKDSAINSIIMMTMELLVLPVVG
jgi:hypothetical protein